VSPGCGKVVPFQKLMPLIPTWYVASGELVTMVFATPGGPGVVPPIVKEVWTVGRAFVPSKIETGWEPGACPVGMRKLSIALPLPFVVPANIRGDEPTVTKTEVFTARKPLTGTVT